MASDDQKSVKSYLADSVKYSLAFTLRFKIIGHLSNIRILFSVDIATGDPVYPNPVEGKYQTIKSRPNRSCIPY